jgi:hypothetical protein
MLWRQGVSARSSLDASIEAWMAEAWKRDEDRFQGLALELFAHQYSHCPPYRAFCEGRGATPGAVDNWREIPAVPTGAFKEFALRCFPEEATQKTFRTSGTSLSLRGELHLDSLALYEASLQPSFEKGLLPEVTGRLPIHVLAPSARESPDSSLSHMFAVMLEKRGGPYSCWLVEGGELDFSACRDTLASAESVEEPCLFAGTAFAWVHLLDALRDAGHRFDLGSRVRLMETGGFKGKSREVGREELYGEMTKFLGVPSERIVNQYGMTELGSQFYDSNLASPGRPRRKMIPPWVRVRALDPVTGLEAAPGAVGMLAILDLANTGSVAAIQTADLGRCFGSEADDGFEVLGRAEAAEARGCSIAADAMLGAQPRCAFPSRPSPWRSVSRPWQLGWISGAIRMAPRESDCAKNCPDRRAFTRPQ